MDYKPLLNGPWLGSYDPFSVARNHISGTAKARDTKFCMQIEYINC